MMTLDMYSLILALATALAAGLVGAFALMKRMSLAGDVISHLALPGLGLAFLYHLNPIVGAATTLFIGILLISYLEGKSGLATETAIGVIFTAAVAIGALLTPKEDLIEALFGGFAKVGPIGFALGMAGVGVIVFAILLLRHKLILALFSPDLAEATDINVRRINFFYLLTFGLAILLGLQFLGAILVGALIIVPAAIGRQLSRTLNQFLMFSALSSMISVFFGYLASNYFNLALGPSIVASAAVLFTLSVLVRKN